MCIWTCCLSCCHGVRLTRKERQIGNQIGMRITNRTAESFIERPSQGTSRFFARGTPSRWWSSRENFVLNSAVSHPFLANAARLQVLGKSPASFYLRLNKRIWERLPSRVRNLYPVRC